MKILIILIFIFSSLVSNSQLKWKIAETGDEFDNDRIKKLSFNTSLAPPFMIIHRDDEELIFDLSLLEEKEIQVSENQNLNFIYDNADFSFNLFSIDSIKFVPKTDIEIAELKEDKILTSNLENPWGMDFISSNELLFTERSGRLWHFNIETETKTRITGLPNITAFGQGGLLDVILHPKFEENSWVYLSYSTQEGNGRTTALGRGKLSGFEFVEFEEIFRALPGTSAGQHFGSRIVFDDDGYVYLSIGDRGNMNNAQDSNNHIGCVVRLFDDGSVPEDNPFIGIPNTKPELFTVGHRNIQGMAINPTTREIWTHEHGPQGGDEINILKAGANYGWPLATFGENYGGGEISPDTSLPGYEDPIYYWTPSIAPCGMTFIEYDTPTKSQDLLVGALAGQHIARLKITDNKVVQEIQSLRWYARFRAVKQAPDGQIYALSENPGRLIRIK